MPGTNGLQTASKLRKMDFQGDIVFYTFNTDHAIDGYDVSALHYVIKDIISDKKRNSRKYSGALFTVNNAGTGNACPYLRWRKPLYPVAGYYLL